VFHLIEYLRDEQDISPSGQKRFGVSKLHRRFQNGAAMTAQFQHGLKTTAFLLNSLPAFPDRDRILVEDDNPVTSQVPAGRYMMVKI